MVKLKKYNPCKEYINELKTAIFDVTKSNKEIIIKYDKTKFITNLTKNDISSFSIDNAKVLYNDKELMNINPADSFFIDSIMKCPSFDYIDIPNLELGGIIKRMYAQIEFGYYSNAKFSQDEISMCDNIFKAVYTNSVSIKQNQLRQCIKKYNELQKQRYINKKVIDGIIYAAYDLYKSLKK